MAKYTENKKINNKKWDDKNLKRMSLAIPIDLYNRLENYAKENELSVNKAIRTAIEHMLDV